MFNNLRELILSMPTEDQCREYLAAQRWPDGKAVCSYCGYGRSYKIKNAKRYKCANDECYQKFSVTVGTIFGASKIPLLKWFTAIYLVASHKKGISSYQLGKDIGVSQKCAWFILHRVRELMRVKKTVKLDNIVEIDETFVGGIVGNMSKTRRAKLRTKSNGTVQNKTMVVGLLERGGNLKLVALGKETGRHIVEPIVRKNVDNDAVLITDSSTFYTGVATEYAGHETVNHTDQEYVRDKVIHTNSIEGAFSLLKRSIIGIYHQVTPKHLSRYCDETMYRYNTRKMKDAARFILSLQQTEGRLKWKDLTAKPIPEVTSTGHLPQAFNAPRPVVQLKDSEIVATFPSINNASRITGIKHGHILRVLKGDRRTTGGFQWKYV